MPSPSRVQRLEHDGSEPCPTEANGCVHNGSEPCINGSEPCTNGSEPCTNGSEPCSHDSGERCARSDDSERVAARNRHSESDNSRITVVEGCSPTKRMQTEALPGIEETSRLRRCARHVRRSAAGRTSLSFPFFRIELEHMSCQYQEQQVFRHEEIVEWADTVRL